MKPSFAPMKKILLILIAVGLLASCGEKVEPEKELPGAVVMDCKVMPDFRGIEVEFSDNVDLSADYEEAFFFSPRVSYTVSAGSSAEKVLLSFSEQLGNFKTYTLIISKGEALGLRIIRQYSFTFTTAYDTSDKFPRITTDELMTLVQKRTFKYFWDYAHPDSGLARERYGSGDIVTIGGSGFGLMAIIAAVERGFISRADAYARVLKIANFLSVKADRFHGAFSHWLNGSTGAVYPFSTYDNGGDLVETGFLMEGLLACRNYFSAAGEAELRNTITELWEAVEWDWFERNDALYWHWSPNYDWQMNMKISGWNEGLIVYVLGASSPTHGISRSTYDNGWARGGGMRNGRQFYGITLPLGSDYGGPLFFAHYSFLGLDPRGLSDQYANYWDQNVAHARINHAYCAANPKGHAGYSDKCWGLTASDIPDGYTASSPTNDNGVIAPTAALASMPYTPEESIAAMEYFYYVLGDRLFGEYGFRDAFSLGAHWFAPSYLAIDQGPIVVMIENYRSGTVWQAFMSDPDVAAGLMKLGFERK